MQLSRSDLAALPLRAALIEREDEVVARTPEWMGATPATVMYPVRNKHLHVSTRPADATAQRLLDELLRVLDAAESEVAGDHALRVRMLGASLRLLAGSYVVRDGDSTEVFELARAGVRARTSLTIYTDAGEQTPVWAA